MNNALVWSLLFAVVLLGIASIRLGLLTRAGGFSAILVGLIALAFGGIFGTGLLFLFFFTSNALSFWRRNKKQSLGFEKGGKRDQWQVLANGGPAIIGLICGSILERTLHQHQTGVLLYAAGLAEANADTWATECGAASGLPPRSIVTGQVVPPGRSGGITWLGTIAAAVGAIVIGFACLYIHSAVALAIKVAVAGFIGSLFDSLLGATVQAQFVDQQGNVSETSVNSKTLVQGVAWLRNDGVNFLGGLSSLLLMSILLAMNR